ncbi:MAG: J domain-containing protein [Proteobacteria bacterium]|nr:J domain-containing protein [Pseudomonadota bacterium]
MAPSSSSIRRILGRRELAPFLYRLGHQGASGLLTLSARTSRAEVFVLRRGGVVVPDGELARRTAIARLTRLVAVDEITVVFESGVAAAPPGTQELVPLATWARQHLEAQLDNSLGELLIKQLAGVRLAIRPELAPVPVDDSDRRMLAAMTQPRRIDQIWPLARTPRFRLLAFLHFLRTIDALDVHGVASERATTRTALGTIPPPIVDARARAARTLGVRDDDDRDTVKRAYRRLARTLHPDLQPDAVGLVRRDLERRFAEITAAYQALV